MTTSTQIKLNHLQRRALGDMYINLSSLYQTYVVRDRGDNSQGKDGNPRLGVSVQLVMPCGTGKTEVIAALLDDDPGRYGLMDEDTDTPLPELNLKESLVLVMTPGSGGLDTQLAERLRKRLTDTNRVIHVREGKAMSLNNLRGQVIVSSYDSLIKTRKVIDEQGNTVREYINKASREDEFANFWSVIEAAAHRTVEVFVIIDEAHWGSNSSKTSIGLFFKEIEDRLGYVPVRVEATATPPLKNSFHNMPGGRVRRVEISEQEFISRGLLLRKELIVNPGRDQESMEKSYAAIEALKKQVATDPNDTKPWQHVVIADLMWKKYIDVKRKANNHEHQPYNPLVLVCISNAKKGAEELEQLKQFFEFKGVTTDNGKLAIWLDDDDNKIDPKEKRRVADLNSKVEVLIFKQSIALGWNCPRAQFLLMVRKPSTSSESFTPQLLGRIKRQPYGKMKGDNTSDVDPLDRAYVYTSQAKLIADKASLGGFVVDDGAGITGSNDDDSNPADAKMLDAWRSVAPLKQHVVRSNRTVVSQRKFEEAVEHFKITDLDKSAADAKTLVIAGVVVTAQDTTIAGNRLESLKYSGGAGYLTGPRLTAEFKQRGLTHAGRHSDGSKSVIFNKVKEYLKGTNNGVEPDDETVYQTILANLSNPTGSFKDLLDLLVKVAADGEVGHKVSWRTRDPEVYCPAEQRGGAYVDTTKPYMGKKAATHLYGATAFTDTSSGSTMSENRFEREVIESSLSGSLVSWLRNSKVIDGDSKAYCLPYVDPKDGSSLREVFPDYVTLLKREDGSHLFVAFEVKGDNTGLDGGDRNVVVSKAKAMRSVTERSDAGWENTAAAVVFFNGNTWVVNLGDSPSQPNVFNTVTLEEWLKERGVKIG